MRLRQKLISGLIGVVILTSALGFFVYFSEMKNEQEGIIKNAENTAKTIGFSIMYQNEEPMGITSLDNIPLLIKEYIKNLHDIKKIDVLVVDTDKKIIADAIPENSGKIYEHDTQDEVGKTLRDGVTRTFIETCDDYPQGIERIVVPLINEAGKTVGALVMDYTSHIDTLSSKHQNKLANLVEATIIAMFIVSVFGYFAFSRITAPIEKLKIAVSEISRGNLDTNVEINSNDEIAELAGMFNKMAFEVKKHIEKLHAANETLRTLGSAVEQTADIVIVTNMDGFIEYVNPAFEKITGYSKEETIGKNPGILNSGRQDKSFYEKLWKIILSGETFRTELINKKKNGDLYYVQKTITPIKDESGNITHFVSIDKDITEQKRMQELRIEKERLEFANIAKSEFLASMSHELRTPLNAIIGFSELMKFGRAGELNEKQKHFMSNISISGNFLLNLINDILDLSKVEAGKIILNIEKISLKVTVEETTTLIKEKAMKHNIKFIKDLDPGIEYIEADKQRVKQILFNLLSNAVKFSKEEGGTVTITTKKIEGNLQISVSDTGIGIKPENIGKMFQKFEQLDKGISQKYGGTGLGLAITKQLVELHGGKIRVESKYGEGSTFTFTMPLPCANGRK
jgi:PAS domain S-box-containing protein